MLPDRVSNPGPLTYESGALPHKSKVPTFKVKVTVRSQRSNTISAITLNLL